MESTWYKAVYVQPFDHGIDDDRLANHYRRGVWIRVSTNTSWSASGDDSHQKAIELIRDPDAKRKPAYP